MLAAPVVVVDLMAKREIIDFLSDFVLHFTGKCGWQKVSYFFSNFLIQFSYNFIAKSIKSNKPNFLKISVLNKK